jgi:hypothetical protein
MLKGLLGGQKSGQSADAPADGSGEKVKPQDALKKLFGG